MDIVETRDGSDVKTEIRFYASGDAMSYQICAAEDREYMPHMSLRLHNDARESESMTVDQVRVNGPVTSQSNDLVPSFPKIVNRPPSRGNGNCNVTLHKF